MAAMPEASVIICAHNPRGAINRFSAATWELLL
jgi:hypothetical protein